MLWDKQGIYLPALLREKQLFSFVLAYVAHDKTTRLPDLARLLICLKLPLLIESQVLCLPRHLHLHHNIHHHDHQVLCLAGQGEDRNEAAFLRSKELLTTEARQFVTASKLFVKSATESEGQLMECLNHCVHMIDRIGE